MRPHKIVSRMKEEPRKAMAFLDAAIAALEGVAVTKCDPTIASDAKMLVSRLERELARESLRKEEPMTMDHLERAFSRVDANGDGVLDPKELQKVFASCGRGFVTTKILAQFIHDFDRDEDGKLNFDEFLEVWDSLNPQLLNAMQSGVDQLNERTAKQKFFSQPFTKEVRPPPPPPKTSAWVLHPRAPVNAEWELVMTVLLVVTGVILPISLSFEELGCRLRWLNVTIDVLFLLDVIKNFNTGFLHAAEEPTRLLSSRPSSARLSEFQPQQAQSSPDGICMDRRIIALRYLKSSFIFDLLSSIPYDNLFFLSSGTTQCGGTNRYAQASRLLKLVRISRIFKVFRLLRVSKTFTKVRNLIIHYEDLYHVCIPEVWIKTGQLLLLLFLGAHWIACLQFFVVAEAGFPPDSWVRFASLHDAPVGRQYVWSYYKALSQLLMIGFETPSAVNQSCANVSEWCAIEHWLTLLCLYFGAIFYSLLISNISLIIATTNVGSRTYRERVQRINEYARARALPASLRDKVKDFYSAQYADGKIFDEQRLLSELTPALRTEILMHNLRDLFEKVPLFAKTMRRRMTALEALAPYLKMTVALESEIIMKEHAPICPGNDDMYFIFSGIFDILYDGRIVETIGDGCYFGDCAVVLGCRRTATVRARVVSMVYALPRAGLQIALDTSDDVAQYVRIVAKSRYDRMKHYASNSRRNGRRSDDVASSPEMLVDDPEDIKTDLYLECKANQSLYEDETRRESDDSHILAVEALSGRVTTLDTKPRMLDRLKAALSSSKRRQKIYNSPSDEEHTVKSKPQRATERRRAFLDTPTRRNSGLKARFQAPDPQSLPTQIARLRLRTKKKKKQLEDRPQRNLLFQRTLKHHRAPLSSSPPDSEPRRRAPSSPPDITTYIGGGRP